MGSPAHRLGPWLLHRSEFPVKSVEILQYVFLFIAWGAVVHLAGKEPIFRGKRLVAFIVFAIAISLYGSFNYVEGKEEVRECLQTQELDC